MSCGYEKMWHPATEFAVYI